MISNVMTLGCLCLLVDIVLQTVLWLCYQVRLHCTATSFHQGQVCIISIYNILHIYPVCFTFYFPFVFSLQEHCPANRPFNFHKYMMRTLEVDFKKVVSIRLD
jgi:hypothetical protein